MKLSLLGETMFRMRCNNICMHKDYLEWGVGRGHQKLESPSREDRVVHSSEEAEYSHSNT